VICKSVVLSDVCNWPINPISNPYPVYSHTSLKTWQYHITMVWNKSIYNIYVCFYFVWNSIPARRKRFTLRVSWVSLVWPCSVHSAWYNDSGVQSLRAGTLLQCFSTQAPTSFPGTPSGDGHSHITDTSKAAFIRLGCDRNADSCTTALGQSGPCVIRAFWRS
jgi:hypothetical protein